MKRGQNTAAALLARLQFTLIRLLRLTGFFFFFAAAGPREAQGETPNLLISSNHDNMLLSADGEQTVIGPGKLRVTGKPWPRPPVLGRDSASATEGSREGHLEVLSSHFNVSFKVVT